MSSEYTLSRGPGAIEELHKRIPDYRITEGDSPEYHNVVIRMATRLPITFPTQAAARQQGDAL